jgi:hypothetical protein
MPEQGVCRELVDLYFRYIHVIFHNLFHRPSFEVQVRGGSIPKVLLFGVFALAARFSSHPSFANIDPKERGRPYAKECERLLDLHKTCLTTIQVCVLLGAIQVVEMDSATESVFYTIACRMAMILDLPNAPAKTRIEQEVNLRGEHTPTYPSRVRADMRQYGGRWWQPTRGRLRDWAFRGRYSRATTSPCPSTSVCSSV